MLERDRQRTRVLLVDDDHDVADSLAEVLRVLDYEVRSLTVARKLSALRAVTALT
jgi:FixJ family two-component response regulator